MKTNKTYLLIILFLISIKASDAQQTLDKFFNSSDAKVTWLGLDFSEVRTLGDVGARETDIKERYSGAINQVVITEGEKYNLAAAFHKENVSSDLTNVNRNNSKMDQSKIATSSSDDMNRITSAMVDRIVKGYEFGDRKGYGVVFIMEGLDKPKTSASMLVTIIDIDSKKVLLTKRMEGKAKGFGFRNYWAGSVYQVLNKIKSTEYNEWKTEMVK